MFIEAFLVINIINPDKSVDQLIMQQYPTVIDCEKELEIVQDYTDLKLECWEEEYEETPA